MVGTPINPTEPPPPPTTNPDGTPLISVSVFDVADPKPVNPNDPWPDQAAEGAFLLAYWKMRGWGVPRWLAWTIGGAAGVAIGVMAYAVSAALWAFRSIAPSIGLFMLKAMADARKSIDPQIPQLAADVLSEMTGADIKAGDLPQGQGFADHLARVTAVGSELHDLLEKEFAPAGTISPDQGAQAARAFSGFNINFGIGTALIALLGEIESLGKLEQFRELGVEVARNLGLGRLHRQALQPLIHTLIATPYTWHLNEKHRPTRLPKEKLIQAFFRKAIDEATMRTELAQEGWTDKRIDTLIEDARPIVNDREIVHLLFQGAVTDVQAKTLLEQRGWADFEADWVIALERPKLDKAETLELYGSGQIDRESTLKGLQRMGYTSDDAELIVLGFEMKIEAVKRPRNIRHKARSFFQLRKEFLDGVIDLIEWNDALTQLGYDVDAIATMTQDLLLDQANRKTTRTTHAVPSLSWAQLKAAFKAGVLDLQEVRDHLTHRGYSAADIDILLKELPPAPTPPPATAA
jgi:hypothetical protein